MKGLSSGKADASCAMTWRCATTTEGMPWRDQGHLSEAIADYGRAIEIYEGLVEREGRRELRNDLANATTTGVNALRVQGHLSEAIADYDRAIEIHGRACRAGRTAASYAAIWRALCSTGPLPEARRGNGNRRVRISRKVWPCCEPLSKRDSVMSLARFFSSGLSLPVCEGVGRSGEGRGGGE